MLTFETDPFPQIETPRLLLKKLVKDYLNEVYILRSDNRVLAYLDRFPIKDLNEAAAWISNTNELERKKEALTWAISHKDDQKMIGTICFWNIQKEHYRAETGYALLPAYQGRGIMQEALEAVLEYGFRVMKLHSVEANVNPGNIPSIRLLERNHFVREAYFRENYFFDGNFVDSAIYSLVNPG